MLKRAWLALFSRGLTVGSATLFGTGLALNSFLAFCAASSRLSRSSRCALTFAEMTSPGSENVDIVGALFDRAGTKPGLLVERLVLGIRFLVVLGNALAGELEKDIAGGGGSVADPETMGPSVGGFLDGLATTGALTICLPTADWRALVLGRTAAGFCADGGGLIGEFFAGFVGCAGVLPDFLKVAGVFVLVSSPARAGVFLADLMGDFMFRPSRAGRSSEIFSMASSSASMASTESSIRGVLEFT